MPFCHGQYTGTDFDDRLSIEISGCFPSTIELSLNALNLVYPLTGARLQRRLECITLSGLNIQDLKVVHTDWMFVAVTLFSQLDTGFRMKSSSKRPQV